MDDPGMFAPLSRDEIAAAEPAQPGRAIKVPIVPVPSDAPEMRFRHPKHGEPNRTWAYRDADGQVVGYACRWDFLDDKGKSAKEVLPVTYCDLGAGRRGWRSKGIPAPRPLYALPAILAHPDSLVLVTEGEKTRDAARDLFPDMVATTPMHGAKSPQLTDFGPLAGRTVVIATDHDEPGRTDDKGRPLHPGRDFGDKVCELARAAGAAEVLHLRPEAVGAWTFDAAGERVARADPLPDGWDLADAAAEGWTAERMAALLAEPDMLRPYMDRETRAAEGSTEDGEIEPDAASGWSFRLAWNGVEKRIERTDKETGMTTVEWRWFCSTLDVAGETRSADGEEWGRLLRVTDRDDRTKEWAMPMSMLAGDGTGYRERLLSLGLTMAPGKFARDALHEYISTARPSMKARCVGRLGWQGKTFVGSTEGFAPADAKADRYIFQTTGAVDHAFHQKGTLASWQKHVGRYAVGNSRLAFALSAAFAAPLLYPVGAESGGFHFRGGSSTGKTTALHVAGSACGGGGIKGYVRTWRATSNGLEGVAAIHNDGLLCLDEMGQVAATDAGATSYMLANGQGKARAGRGGEARRSAEWRMVFLSSGELSLADKIAEDGRGRRAAAGQEVRIVDIPADAGAGHGMFENLHGFASGGAFSRHLRFAAAEHYGEAWCAFMRLLVRDFDGIAPAVKGYADEFVAEECPAGADGQVSRVCARFALVAAGGEMATAFGVLPWPPGEASRAAARCFRDWLAQRGGVEPAEEREAIATVRRFIELHGASRFEAMGELAPRDGAGIVMEQRIANRVGFKRRTDGGGVEYLVLPEAWKSEVCVGLDATMVARVLRDRKLLAISADGKTQDKVRLPIAANPLRVFRLRAAILDGVEDQPAAGRF